MDKACLDDRVIEWLDIPDAKDESGRPKHNVGDHVWIAMSDTVERHIPCPDCGATKILTVTLFDGTELRIPCQGCQSGCNPPSGLVGYWEHFHTVGEGEIVGIEKRKDGYEYSVESCGGTYIKPESEISLSEFEAERISKERAEHITEENRRKAEHKYRDERSWAWHVTHYRREIKEAKKRIEYAERALGIAREKAKEEKRQKS